MYLIIHNFFQPSYSIVLQVEGLKIVSQEFSQKLHILQASRSTHGPSDMSPWIGNAPCHVAPNKIRLQDVHGASFGTTPENQIVKKSNKPEKNKHKPFY